MWRKIKNEIKGRYKKERVFNKASEKAEHIKEIKSMMNDKWNEGRKGFGIHKESVQNAKNLLDDIIIG